MKMTKKERTKIVKEMEEISKEIQDRLDHTHMLWKEAPDFDDHLKKLSIEIIPLKSKLEEIVLEQIRKYTNDQNPENWMEIYGYPEKAFDMLYSLVGEKSEEERKKLYDFIKSMMEKFDLTCPPIEVFDDKTLQIWSNEYEKMLDILESLNDSHYCLLAKAGHFKQLERRS